MDFFTIGQYFNKLYSTLLFILLVPIIAFMVVYLQVQPLTRDDMQSLTLFFRLVAIVAAIWILILIFELKKIKSIRNEQGLRTKLEKFFYLTIVRFFLVAIGCLILAYGFQETSNDWFTGIFVLNLIVLALQWPTPSRVTRRLRLRGDEREMVFFKKDKL